ncbi:MAG: type II CAAX endopeptidase family protein [Bacteroidia bacterium]|nr:type II CAAX endopeptidase family protein [Bacteroidia bacterium]
MVNKKVVLFLTFTFGLTWLLWWLLAFLKHDNSQIYSNPMFFILFAIGGLAPTIASYISIKFSDRNYKSFNKAVWKWRINILYYLFCIVSVLGVRYLSIAVYGLIFKPIWADITPQFLSLLPLIFLMILFGGLEEFGWRGLLLPELNKKFNLPISAIVVGLIWGLWHLPLFFIQWIKSISCRFPGVFNLHCRIEFSFSMVVL